MERRSFLQKSLIGLSTAPLASRLAAGVPLPANPFTLGIASGEPGRDNAILWTRLAPQPDRADGGMPPVDVAVHWEVARNADMSAVVQRGQSMASPDLAHSVHVELQDLEPNRHYWYRFATATHQSPVGRTKTLPANTDPSSTIRFVTASCQNYTHGHFHAYAHMLAEQPDFVMHLGDYLYDTAFGETFRLHETDAPPRTLQDYRRRHALYKGDPQLQQAHAQLPFFVTIDNHDAVEDAEPGNASQRAAAYQAWYEHMPVRGYGGIGANTFELHRKISIGDLLQISLLDARQYRDTKAPCTGPFDADYGFGNYREYCSIERSENRSMLGARQEQWLTEQLRNNRCAWNVIASPGPFLPFTYRHQDKDLHYIGAWDAYPANRRRAAAALRAAQHGHPLVLSGDVHSFWAVDGRQVERTSDRVPVVELVTSSISANWPAPLAQPVTNNLKTNPQVGFYEPGHRGYLLHTVQADTWTAQARGLDSVTDPESAIRTIAQFSIANGSPGFTLTSGGAGLHRDRG